MKGVPGNLDHVADTTWAMFDRYIIRHHPQMEFPYVKVPEGKFLENMSEAIQSPTCWSGCQTRPGVTGDGFHLETSWMWQGILGGEILIFSWWLKMVLPLWSVS